MDSKELDEFIKNILEEKQLSGVTNEVREQLLVDMRERLLDQINRALIGAMSEDKIEALNLMLDNNSSEDDVQSLIENSGVDVSEIVTKTMIQFRNLYIGTIKNL